MLKDGDVIPQDRARVPTDVNTVLDATNRGLAAIPRDNLQDGHRRGLYRVSADSGRSFAGW